MLSRVLEPPQRWRFLFRGICGVKFSSGRKIILPEFLSILRLEPDQWTAITRKIQQTNVLPSNRLVEMAFYRLFNMAIYILI
jgi:hypothetical protein